MSQSPLPNSFSQVIVLSVLHDSLTPTQASARFGMSRRQIHRLLVLYKHGGLEALEPRSRRPKGNPRALSPELRAEIIRLRTELLVGGLDAGAASIAWHLGEAKLHVPALSTIWRILRAAGLVTPTPSKRPKAYITRFEAVQPNETWQSDFTHWRLKDGLDVEIINWLDDHSRLLLHCSVYKAITGKIVIDTFNECRKEYGTPFSTLTDNGIVYTGRFVKGKNGFEYLLSELDIVQKNGSPAHPQTQGKIERFHQTLKKWLLEQEAAKDLKELQRQLDEFPRSITLGDRIRHSRCERQRVRMKPQSKQHLKLPRTKSTTDSVMTASINLENYRFEEPARCITWELGSSIISRRYS